MLTTEQILARLAEKDIRNVDIARILGVNASRIIWESSWSAAVPRAGTQGQKFGEPKQHGTQFGTQWGESALRLFRKVLGKAGSPGLIRTGDHSINSRTLYR
jgi:hypothetical protein